MMSIEIDLPDDVSDEYLRALIEDLTYEPHLERLENGIQRWVRFVTGETCSITVTAEE